MEDNKCKQKTVQTTAHQIALDCIQTQPIHGSPYHVYPYPSPVRLLHAFRSEGPLSAWGIRPYLDIRFATPPPQETQETEEAQESPVLGRPLSFTPRSSPVPARVSHLNDKFHDSLSLTGDTDALVAKISRLFPTVSETHIRILLKKYYNREAVVISALQVEKHPMASPAPQTSSTPLPQRSATVTSNAMPSGSMPGSSHYTPINGTPQGSPLLRSESATSANYGMTRQTERAGPPTRHPSPKMKLKYLKCVFPQADETLIIDVLTNKDNNVQRASEELIGLGYVKRDISTVAKKKDAPTPQPAKKVILMKNTEEKQHLHKELKKKYSWMPGRLINIALESFHYDLEKADDVLSTVVPDEIQNNPLRSAVQVPKRHVPETYIPDSSAVADTERAVPPAPVASKRLKTWTENLKPILKNTSGAESKFKSTYSSQAKGPNAALRRGPQESLLLEDYMPWNGPNPEYRSGNLAQAEGSQQPEVDRVEAQGPAGLAQGPSGLAHGSVYQKSKKKSAKIVI